MLLTFGGFRSPEVGRYAMGKCVFSNLWLQKSPYKEWLREVKGDKHKARCIVYMKDVDISSMGESAPTSHLKGKKHQTLTSQKRSSARVPDFFGVSSQPPATKSDDAKVVSKSASSESGEHSKLNVTKSTASSSGSSVMEKSVIRDESLKAEILWALKAIMSHHSYKSCEGTSQFSCGEPLLLSASGASQKYSSYLDEQKRKKTSEGVELKRKELVNELDELKKEKKAFRN